MTSVVEQRPAAHAITVPGLQTYRCSRCDRMLGRMKLPPGATIEIKCASCNAFTILRSSEKGTV